MTETWNPRLFLYAGHSGHFGIDDFDHGINYSLEPMDLPSARSVSPTPTDSNNSLIDVELTYPISESPHEPTSVIVPQSVNPVELGQTHNMASMAEAAPLFIKKSRGRKVPTSQNFISSDGQRGVKDRRHVCEICGGQFKRGEHLKRHVRSIHTQDRRTSVAFGDCLSG